MNPDQVPCSAEHNQYEDDWVCALRSWLQQVTDITWVREHPNSARPDEMKSQFGLIEVESIEYKGKLGRKRESTVLNEDEACAKVEMKVNVTIQLTVVNWAVMPEENQQKFRTGGDVLMRVLDSYYMIPHLSEALGEHGISLKDNEVGQINNFEENAMSSIERRSNMRLELCITRKTSFADCKIKGFIITVGCKNNNCNEENKNGN